MVAAPGVVGQAIRAPGSRAPVAVAVTLRPAPVVPPRPTLAGIADRRALRPAPVVVAIAPPPAAVTALARTSTEGTVIPARTASLGTSGVAPLLRPGRRAPGAAP